jgi:DNA-binding LacI/PurR family transcriptional regulator/DNA-binding transcriptional regulator YhcF (GntR family)
MPSASNPLSSPSIPDLAGQLASFMQERGLVPGDRFLTTKEAAQHLRVRRDLANRALQVLAQRGLIERAQRIGSRVSAPQAAPRTLERVHIVVQANHPRAQHWSSAAFQVGLHAALPGCEIDVDQVSAEGAAAVLRSALRQPSPEGLVLVRCDYPTQRLAENSGLPAVLHGSPYAGITLPSVDVDGAQMGQLQAQALIQSGCERLVVVRRDRALPGDRAFMTGFRAAAQALGFGCNEIDELELAPFAEVVAAELKILFRKAVRLGIVCSARELADATWNAAMASGRRAGEGFWLHCNQAAMASGTPAFPYLAPSVSDEEQGAELGRLLAARLADPSSPAIHQRVSCKLIHPGVAP